MRTTLDAAIEAAQIFFENPKITRDTIRRDSKKKMYVEPRNFVMAYLRASNPTLWSYPKIIETVGRADHSTAIYGITRAHEKWGHLLFKKLTMKVHRPRQGRSGITQVFHKAPDFDELMSVGRFNLQAMSGRGVFHNNMGWVAA